MSPSPQRWFAVLWIGLFSLALSGCSGATSPSTPTTPSPSTPTPLPADAAALTIIPGFVIADTYLSSGIAYQVVYGVRETGGLTSASLGAVTVRRADGAIVYNSTPTNPPTVAASGSYSSGILTFTDPAGVRTPTMTLTRAYTDTKGNTGTLSAAMTVEILRRATLAGVVRDGTSGVGVPGATVRINDTTNKTLTAVTDGNGYYSIPGVAANGSTSFSASLTGYTTLNTNVSVFGDTTFDCFIKRLGLLTPGAFAGGD